MAQIEVKMRLNTENEEVEVLIGDEVLAASSTELFVNWVNWYNEKHKPAPVVEVVPEVVETQSVASQPALDTPAESPSDVVA